jgi:hypothetical protein
MSSSSISRVYKHLSEYLVGKEKGIGRYNTLLRDVAISNSAEKFSILVSQGYNPYRIFGEKMAFEYALDTEKFEKLSVAWIDKLAFETDPDLLNYEDKEING